MSVVCIDTQILFWGIIGQSTRGSEDFISKANSFLKWLDKQGDDVIIPSIVVGEMLVPVHSKEYSQALAKFQENWIVADYDLNAAVTFANLREDHRIKNRIKSLQFDSNITRKELIADVMILATAIAHSATKMYTYDKNLIKMGEGLIEVINFTEVPYQLDLPFRDENDKSE